MERTEPPINQVRYLLWYPELSKGNPHGNGYFSELTTLESIRDRLAIGIAILQIKQWLLYS